MAPKSDQSDQLDLALPAEIMKLGEALSARGSFRRSVSHDPTARQPDPDQADATVDALLAKVVKHPMARIHFGLHRKVARESARARIKVIAVMAWQALRLSADSVDIGELAVAIADPKSPPAEALLRARHEIGVLVADDTILGFTGDPHSPIRKARLPCLTLEWLSGGRSSMGSLTATKLANTLLSKGAGEPERTADTAQPLPIPTVKNLQAKLSERVIGLEGQSQALASRLVLHLARAKMLRAGRDSETGNQAVLLAGSSGCGKTYLMSEAAKLTGCPFSSQSATAWTSEGFIGGKFDDLLKALVMNAKGDVQAGRFGIALADEWDKKAFRYGNGSSGRDLNTLCIQQEVLVPMQGAEFPICGKKAMERTIIFNSAGTFFAFAGVFEGLREMVAGKNSRTCLGFTAGTATPKRYDRMLDALREYGYVREWVNRLTAVIFLPDPTVQALGMAAANGILNGFNALLAELGIILFPQPGSIQHMAEFAYDSKAFYRGVKSVWWSLAEAAVSAGTKGTVLISAADVDAAIARVASGSVGLREEPDQAGQAATATQVDDADDLLAGGSAGG